MEHHKNHHHDEVYTLHLYSENGDITGDRASVTYTVNWTSFLPKKYRKFKTAIRFKSKDNVVSDPADPATDSNLNDNVNGILVTCNLPSSQVFSTLSNKRQVFLAFLEVSGVAGADGTYYWSPTYTDFHSVINYPTEDRLTVNLLDPHTQQGSSSEPYHIFLMFYPVE